MNEEQLTLLIGKYLSGEASEAEKKQVEDWYESLERSTLQSKGSDGDEITRSEARSLAMLKRKIAARHGAVKGAFPGWAKQNGSVRSRQLAAAAVIVLIASALFFFLSRSSVKNKKVLVSQSVQTDILPGGNKAVLTLGNGIKITLDSIHNGLVSTQGKTRIVQLTGGKLAYQIEDVIAEKPVLNTITTPMGGYYQVVLPDGTHVWLNAASSIRFPTAFSRGEREVRVTGEAYFEIAEKRNSPFKVHVNGMTIQVLGTHFNVMAYQDEAAVSTTLLEGRVKITQGDAEMILTPGQQLSLTKAGKMKLLQDAEINKVIAWKNHLFWFDNDDIQTIMRQLARWYNIPVVIKGNIPGHFTGSLPRNVPVSKVFEVLQKTGSIHYSIESGKIIVTS